MPIRYLIIIIWNDFCEFLHRQCQSGSGYEHLMDDHVQMYQKDLKDDLDNIRSGNAMQEERQVEVNSLSLGKR